MNGNSSDIMIVLCLCLAVVFDGEGGGGGAMVVTGRVGGRGLGWLVFNLSGAARPRCYGAKKPVS